MLSVGVRTFLQRIALLAALMALGLAQAALADVTIDLATAPHELDLVPVMQMQVGAPDQRDTPSERLTSSDWIDVQADPQRLIAPRQHSALWLKASLTNTGTTSLTRWLEVLPWRLNQVDAWLVDPAGMKIIDTLQMGQNMPAAQRRIHTSRALIPVTLGVGQSVQLLLYIKSDSRPFLTVHSWEPTTFVAEAASRYQFHTILLTITLTLIAVLLLQADRRYTLLALWMLVMFIFESEKEGYISFLLFDEAWAFADHLRFSSAIMAKSLFMIVSVYLLGLEKQGHWRWLTPAASLISALYVCLTFLLDGVVLRQIGAGLLILWQGVWLLMVIPALRQRRPWQRTLVLLLGTGWITSALFLVSYTLNIHYSGRFDATRIILETAVVLGVLLTFARQRRDEKSALEHALRNYERSERRRLEQAVNERVKELHAALDAAQKADEGRTRFLQQVSHDLKSPLTAIMGYAQLLRVEEGKVGKLSGIIHNSASHMLSLISRLIDYARDATSATAAPTHLYLYAFLNSIKNEALILAEKNHNGFLLDLAQDLPPVIYCDETFLREILLNLVDNACKHTQHGEVSIHVKARPGSDGATLILVFDVIDNGSGIPAERQARLFEPFFRVSEATEGVGLGLAIVRELTLKMNGDITLASHPGHGTRVTIQLPIQRGQEDADRALLSLPNHMLPWYDAAGQHAWVVEDAAEIRDLLVMELSSQGFNAIAFENAERALDALKTSEPHPALILTDHQLPGKTGDTILHAAHQCTPAIPVILLSANWALQSGSPAQGAQNYAARLGKPVDLVMLRREIARACGLQLLPAGRVPGSDTVRPPGMGQLDDEALKKLALWLELGAVTDIIEWCDELTARNPDLATRMDEIRSFAECGDFASIRKCFRTVDFEDH